MHQHLRKHQHTRTLYQDDSLRITDFECRRFGCDKRFWEERSEDHEILFLRSGMYVRHVGGEEIVGDANHVQFFNRDEPNQTTHPLPGGDDSTVIALSDEVLLDMLAARDPWVRDRPDLPFSLPQCLFSRQSYRLHNELMGRLWESAGAFEIHEQVMVLVDSVLDTVYADGGRVEPKRAASAHRELAESVKIQLHERMAEGPTLAQLARDLFTSPYHLARVFRRQTGVSVHRYLTRLRLRAALEQLRGGEHDLSQLAHRLGFADHSHFTNSFRRELGVAPSRFREL